MLFVTQQPYYSINFIEVNFKQMQPRVLHFRFEQFRKCFEVHGCGVRPVWALRIVSQDASGVGTPV